VAFSAPAPEPAGNWQVQEGTLTITVAQFGSEVQGRFTDWSADITFDETREGEKGTVTVTVAIPSLTLGTVTADALGAAFFHAEAFPTATYSGPITETDDGYAVDGTLTLKGVDAPVPLAFSLDIDGDRAEMRGSAALDRRTFNVGEGYDDETTVGFGVDIAVTLIAEKVVE